MAAAGHDVQVQQAINSLVRWKAREAPQYDYRRDPLLDRVDSSCPGVWKFDQPWPENVCQVVFERAEVVFDPRDKDGTVKSRQMLLDQSCRRVTVSRTGEVEEMRVTGHWWDRERLNESNLGLLPRSIVRELNLIVTAKQFAARINCLQQNIREHRNVLELFIDLAVDESPKQNSPRRFKSR